ncbi:MAG: DsbA family protein [Thermodesulfobacteriota bacterium]
MRTILTILAILLLISLGINAWTISQLSTVKKGMKNQQLKVTKLADDIKKLQTAGPRKPSQPDTPKEVLVSFDDDYIKGDPKAPVTIVEFSDYQCPYCRKFHNEILPQIQEEYISKGKVRYIFRDFPLSFHKQAVPAAIAANCAGEQGKYWEMNNFLFANPGKLSTAKIIPEAESLGLDKAKFEACVNDDSKKAEVDADFKAGRNYGVRGTPSLFIGKTGDGTEMNALYLRGLRQFDSLKLIIDKKLSAN